MAASPLLHEQRPSDPPAGSSLCLGTTALACSSTSPSKVTPAEEGESERATHRYLWAAQRTATTATKHRQPVHLDTAAQAAKQELGNSRLQDSPAPKPDCVQAVRTDTERCTLNGVSLAIAYVRETR